MPPRLSNEQIAARRRALPVPDFPPDLPVSGRQEEIARAIGANQVVIVCGETGSGKTTQLPKICLSLGRGAAGVIGHTQPRRIAARATAARIAQELKTELGRGVGFKIRFTDRSSPESYIKLMTDGILLAETQTDPLLSQYDTLIIDEAHERSLNIDFLLGYLKGLLPRRPDLKLIITSATIDAERFSKHFDGAPAIEVSGRLYPVELRWRPWEEEGDRDLGEAIADAVDEVSRAGPGDVLVFLPGEREIRDAAESLRKHHPPGTEILPLYARLSAQEQERIFKPHGGRRIVLATNVAETSLTVPGIRYVVDTGLARVKRYSYRNKVEQLRVENVSQAAARQRAGRCGRVAAGVCIRLYSEEDFAKRPAFTDPEVLRSSLAAVILRMKSLGLGEPEQFPFIDPPAPRAITDGYALLAELGAVDEQRELTAVGRQLAKLPLDPRIGRMILAAKEEGSLPEILIIASGLSVQDPRERPAERAQAADEAQKKFDDEKSDFLSWLKLWKFFDEAVAHKKSNRQLHELCRQHFLSQLRLREWRDVHRQLHEMVAELGWKTSTGAERRPAKGDDRPLAPGGRWPAKGADLPPITDDRRPADYARIHRALLAGLLGNIGMKSEEGDYLGARGIRFRVHPGSGAGKKAGRWVMAAELTETTRLYARCVAGVEPQWLESVGAHLLRRSHAEPHWEKSRAQVVAAERGVLYGLPVYVNRRIHYGPLDPKASREVFIRRALVEGDWESKAPFFQHNQRLIREIEKLEHKSRRPDVLVDDALIFAFYDSRVPEGIHNGADFEAWRREAEAKNTKLLFLRREDLMRHEAAGITTAQFPPQLVMAGRTFALEYRHEPGGPRDGVTLTVPLVALNQVSAARTDWLVPGLQKEKATQLARSLPQRLRHRLGSLPEFVTGFLDAEAPDGEAPVDSGMAETMARHARRELNLDIPLDAFRPEVLPAHLLMNFRVVDEHGRQLGMGRNLAQLRAELGAKAGNAFAQLARLAVRRATEAASEADAGAGAAAKGAASAGIPDQSADMPYTAWDFGPLEEVMEIRRGSQTLIGYPALVDRGDGVSLEVLDSEEKAQAEHRKGLRRLFMLALKEQAKFVEKGLPGLQQLSMQFMSLGDAAELRRQLQAAAFDRACLAEPWPRDAEGFAKRVTEGRSRVNLIAQEVVRLAGAVLTERDALTKKLVSIGKSYPAVVKDIEAQLARLLPKRFIEDTPWERLQHLPRYLKAAALRIDKLRAGGAEGAARDARAMQELAPLETQWQRELARQQKSGAAVDPQIEQFRWLLEELRVQLFAQELKTPIPVSVKRLQKAWQGMQR